MRLKSIIQHNQNLAEIISSKGSIAELKSGLERGYAYKIDHSIDRNYLRNLKESLDSTLDLQNNDYTPRVAE